VILDDEDEVLEVLAEQMSSPNFLNYLGGPKHFDKLLDIFSVLSVCEDEEVRLNAT